MKTKNIFKTLALAMLMPATLLTTACSSEDDLANNNENTIKKGYELPITINVSRQGDEGTTRATFDDGTKKLSFSAGDKLFVSGTEATAGKFAGTLTWQSGGTFSGTLTTQNEFTGTAQELLAQASSRYAALLPNEYETYGFLTLKSNTGYAYDYSVYIDYTKTFAPSKAKAVEQFSLESSYSYSDGFTLYPQFGIVNFTITGLAANSYVTVTFSHYSLNIGGTVKTDGSGNATFAVGLNGTSTNLNNCTLYVNGNPITLVTSYKAVDAGHIYNITRSKVTDLSTLNADYEAKNGETLTGTLTGNYKISIADGATVTLDGVNITNLGNGCDWAGINCPGDATIILKGTNEICAGRDGDGNNNYPGIWIAPGKTLNIMGDGSLTAYSDATDPYGAGIGGGYEIACGNINISGGTINATGGSNAAGIGGGDKGACGTITISGGTITATGGTNSPGIGSGDHGSCDGITISGGTVTASSSTNQSTAIGRGVGGSCTSVTITTGITSLTMTNSYAYATGIVSDFINATAIYANSTNITAGLSMSVTDATLIAGMSYAGFTTDYNSTTKTWTVTKK